jgi:hypothetical protein
MLSLEVSEKYFRHKKLFLFPCVNLSRNGKTLAAEAKVHKYD